MDEVLAPLGDLFAGSVSQVLDGNMDFRYGSHAAVLKNRERYFERIGVPLKDSVWMAVTHGTDIAEVGAAERGQGTGSTDHAIAVDALITKDAGTYLVLPTGDCLPVAVLDPRAHVLALAHMSWKNTDRKFGEKLIVHLRAVYGSQPEDLRIAIGPAIHQESYRFSSKEVAQKQADKSAWQPFLRESDGIISIDILGYALAQFGAAGVSRTNISTSPVDTGKDLAYFSHYRSVRTGEPDGRFITVAGVRAW